VQGQKLEAEAEAKGLLYVSGNKHITRCVAYHTAPQLHTAPMPMDNSIPTRGRACWPRKL